MFPVFYGAFLFKDSEDYTLRLKVIRALYFQALKSLFLRVVFSGINNIGDVEI